MRLKSYLNTLRPADRLVLPKSDFKVVQHHVIYLGKNNFGTRVYIENVIGRGVQVVDEAHLFRNGFKLTRVERFVGNQYQRDLAIQMAVQLIGEDYDLLGFNCEHYANMVQTQKSFSKQVSVGIGLALLGLVLSIGLLSYKKYE